MKTKILGIIISCFLGSCTLHNRMTSPYVIDKKERVWTIGAAIDPLELIGEGEMGSPAWSIQPVIGYRTGIAPRQEMGLCLYGAYTPGFVLDYKYNFINTGKFLLSGNLSAFGGPLRPSGFQYDFLFGNRKLYGTIGANYDFSYIDAHSYWIIGLGSERINDKPFGFQISFQSSFPEYYYDNEPYIVNYLSVGLKFDLLRNKKKYRE